MASAVQHEFIEILARHLPGYFRGAKVLEVGSLDVNGSIRPFFDHCEYIGIDVAEGDGVDVVCQGQDYDGPDDSFDHVVSCEAMEHNPAWKETFANMIRLCRPGGMVSMTCAAIGRREHGTTRSSPESSPLTVHMGWDYYRNLSPGDFSDAFDLGTHFAHHGFWHNWAAYNLYFAGIKRGTERAGESALEWQAFERAVDRAMLRHNVAVKSVLHRVKARTLGEAGIGFLRKFRL